MDVVEPDTEAPGPVTHRGISAATTTSLTLGWTNPGDSDFAGVMIRRKTGTLPPTLRTRAPWWSTPALPPRYVNTGLTPGKTYSYALVAHDEVPNNASPETVIGVTDSGGPSTTSDWPQGRQGPEHQSWSPGETVIRPSNVGTIAEEWSTTETGTPVIAGTTLFVSGNDPDGSSQLKAYDLTTGATLWRKDTDSCFGQPALTPTLVVLNCGSSIRAYQRGGTHELVWDTDDTDPGQSFCRTCSSSATPSWLGPPTGWSATGSVTVSASGSSCSRRRHLGRSTSPPPATSVVVAYDDRLRALSATNGAQLWSKAGVGDLPGRHRRRLGVHEQGRRCEPLLPGHRCPRAGRCWPDSDIYRLEAADNDTIYVWNAVFDFGPPSPSVLRALRTTDGSQRWQYDVPSRIGSVAVTGNLVWLTSTDIYSQGRGSDLIALNRLTGARLKQFHFEDNMYGWTDVAFGAGKVILDQGGTFGDPCAAPTAGFGASPARSPTSRRRCYRSAGSARRSPSTSPPSTRPDPSCGRSPADRFPPGSP